MGAVGEAGDGDCNQELVGDAAREHLSEEELGVLDGCEEVDAGHGGGDGADERRGRC